MHLCARASCQIGNSHQGRSEISEKQYRAQCHAKGWTRPYRPSVNFTNSLKKLQMKKYGYPLADIGDYEEDHLVPLCLAGSAQDPANLWPQPRFGEWSADRKDRGKALSACLRRVEQFAPQH